MNANSSNIKSRMTTTPVGKKRKTNEADDTSSSSLSSKGLLSTLSSSFIVSSFPDIIWESIASYSSPPDVYNLALTSNYFHYNSNSNANDDAPLLATRLLRKSLLSSFARVLNNSSTGIDINAALQLSSALPKGKCVFAGSAMVQTCLGEVWEGGDVDIYCLNEVAPQVRSWLVEKAKSIFVGFKDYCISLDDERLTFTINTNIHHCEHYGSLMDNAEYRGKDITEYYAETTEWGRGCNNTYVPQKWLRTIGLLGRDCHNAEYKIRPKMGGDLPFDFDENCRGNIDLIVGVKVPSELLGTITAHDLLDSFDLTICKASFDGTTFKIPEPHLLFNRKSTMEPVRGTLLQCYMHHYGNVVKLSEYDMTNYHLTANKSLLPSCVIDNVRRDLPFADDFFKWVDIAKKIPDPSYDSDDSRDSWYRDVNYLFSLEGQIKYGASIQFHNWICKLHHRLKKYQARGIEILDAPTIDDSIVIREFSLTGY